MLVEITKGIFVDPQEIVNVIIIPGSIDSSNHVILVRHKFVIAVCGEEPITIIKNSYNEALNVSKEIVDIINTSLDIIAASPPPPSLPSPQLTAEEIDSIPF